ncbi:GNAT family N-acetyltransferase [Hoeflea sp.]|uniref:GNAT family N-acetyltransferase n=1 Tax=Hoeflea sp. TaxID=1940281 RepID=UPI0037483EDE
MKGLTRAVAEDRERVELFQKAAYARTEAVIGAQAIPLEWDYGAILQECEVWLYSAGARLEGVLILRLLEKELFLESIATDPNSSGSGLGRMLMDATFERARALQRGRVALMTNSRNPAAGWYKKLGFVVDSEEAQEHRMVLHMSASAMD